MAESGAVNFFWDFLRRYFKNCEIKRHPPFEILVHGNKKTVSPDFLVDSNSKTIFEFKELKDSQVENSHRDRLINRYARYGTEPVPYIVHRFIESAMSKCNLQLIPADKIGCPGVLVIYSAIHALRLHLNRHNRFTSCMYIQPDKFHQKRTPMNRYTHISALAYFSVDNSDPNTTLYRIRFYHNVFAKNQMPIKPFIDNKCQHYTISEDLSWHRVLDHEEVLNT